ncbi:MAG: SH3 domain-containing protein [Paracoccaceae bacterium]
MRLKVLALASGLALALGLAIGAGMAAFAQEATAEGDGAAEGGAELLAVAKTDADCRPGFGCVTNLPLPRFVSLKGDEGNARRGPGLTHRIDWVFTRPGMPLKITAEYEHWRRVEDQDGAGGWVHYSLLSGVRSVMVTLDMAELRDAPDGQVLAQAELGVVARVQECTADWCRISADGEKGWVQKSALWGVAPGEVIE